MLAPKTPFKHNEKVMNYKNLSRQVIILICFLGITLWGPPSIGTLQAAAQYSNTASCLNAIYYWETAGIFADKVINFNGTYEWWQRDLPDGDWILVESGSGCFPYSIPPYADVTYI